jgi:MFS family permease
MNVPLGMFVIILAFWKLKGEWAEAKGEKFDIMGSVLYGLAIIALMYGITLLPALRSLGLILLGFFGIWAFFKWESSVESPVFDLRLFRNNKVFAYSNLAALISYSATFAVTFLLSLYLQNIKGLSPQGAGLILVSQPVVMAIFSPISGRLSDKIEPRIVASIGMAFTTFGLFLLTFLNENSTVTFLLVSLILLGFGFALFASPNTNAIMSSVEKRFYGLASGAMGTMRQLGMMISMGVATLVFAVLIGRVQITPEHYPAFMKSLKWAFSIFSILCLGGIFASLVRGKLRPGDSKEPPRQR